MRSAIPSFDAARHHYRTDVMVAPMLMTLGFGSSSTVHLWPPNARCKTRPEPEPRGDPIGRTTASVQAAVTEAMTTPACRSTSYTVTLSPATARSATGQAVSVTVAFNWGAMGFSSPSLGDGRHRRFQIAHQHCGDGIGSETLNHVHDLE